MVYEINEYQDACSTTAIYPKQTQIQALAYLGLKLNGEAGEVAELIGKHIRDEQTSSRVSEERRQKLIKELGDVMWYVAMLSKELGITLHTVAWENISKLKSRKERGVLQGSGSDR